MRTIIICIIVSVAVVAGYHFLLNNQQEMKIGYVRTGLVLKEYKAMQDANSQFEQELQVSQRNVDTLRIRYEKLLAENRKGDSDWGYRVGVAEKEFRGFAERANEQLQQREQELTASVIDRVNKHIQDYGHKNGYRLILGSTLDGNILHGEEGDDLTDEILAELNASYQPGAGAQPTDTSQH